MAINPSGGTWVLGSLREHWGWMLALGILMVVLGVIGLYMSASFTIASVLVFGALLVVGGVARLIEAFRALGWKSIALHILIALVYLVAGGMALYDPLAASLSLTLFIAAMLLVTGVLRAVIALQMRPVRGWVWVLGGGIISIFLGALIFLQWPVSGLLAIGLFVAIELMIDGWGCIWIALAAKSVGAGDTRQPRPAY
jgi:uncharacterized membrane protein HdeD (DUF308 family)